MISDHFHPWSEREGASPFVWTVLGAIAESTTSMRIGTGVTCPTIRIHPAIIAKASATTAALLRGRFFLSVGTGENLNEHIVGPGWPEWPVRAEMLEEAVGVIRDLCMGRTVSHHGSHYQVEGARLYTLPDDPIPLYVAAGGRRTAELAGRLGDGLVCTSPTAAIATAFQRAGGDGPRFAQVTVCWAERVAAARKTAREWWPQVVLHGAASQELPLPANFEALTKDVSEQQVADEIPCGPDPQLIIDAIERYVAAGFDHVYLHQVGPDQAGLLEFAGRELVRRFARVPVSVA